ncbi:hypothetical protein NNO_0194 [Hydrogenimonas sp.]|nr:hypothetical protein NNO_0194 [Hydrogenimonas sp.]
MGHNRIWLFELKKDMILTIYMVILRKRYNNGGLQMPPGPLYGPGL